MLGLHGSFTALADNKHLETLQSESSKNRVDAAKYIARSGLTEIYENSSSPKLRKSVKKSIDLL